MVLDLLKPGISFFIQTIGGPMSIYRKNLVEHLSFDSFLYQREEMNK